MRKTQLSLASLGAIAVSVAVAFFKLKSVHLGEEKWLKIKGWFCLGSISIYSEGNSLYNKTVKHDFIDYVMFYEVISAIKDIGGVLK